MRAYLTDVGAPRTMEPLTCTRPLHACPVANQPLGQVLTERLQAAGFTPGTAAETPEPCLWVRGDAWIDASDLDRLRQAVAPLRLVTADGETLAWISGRQAVEPGAPAVTAAPGSFRLRYPWDLLRVNEILVGGLAESVVEGQLSPGVHIEGCVRIGSGTRLLPGVFIEGNAAIGRDCKIGPNCYIRGSTSIGDGCHLGQAVEVKNSILLPGVGIGHLSYCGDSIVGENANFGAGTITANFRHDGRNHRSTVGEALLDTGRRKLGAIIGDDVHTGIHTSIYPGRKLWPHTWTRPGAVVQRDLTESDG